MFAVEGGRSVARSFNCTPPPAFVDMRLADALVFISSFSFIAHHL